MARVESLERRRLLSAGDLDPAFGGGDGVVTIDSLTETSEQIHFIGRQGLAGKLIVGGSVGDRLALYRLNADGSTDTSFGTDGQTLVTVPELFANGSEVFAIDAASGRIAVANSMILGDDQVHLRMFLANGQPDTSFGGGDGALDLALTDHGSWLGFQSTGKLILAVGGGDDALHDSTTVTRLNADGSTDMTFGGGAGSATFSFGFDDIEIAPDDRIVIGSTTYTVGTSDESPFPSPSRYEVALERLTADGALDTTFDDDGIRQVAQAEGDSSLPHPIAYDLVAEGDGDVHLLWVEEMTFAKSHIASFTENGDAGGGFSGLLSFAQPGAFGRDFGYDSEGRIIVAGSIGQSTGDARFVARFLPDGSPDLSYADRGAFVVPPEYVEPGTLHGLVLPDGRALLAASLGIVPDHSIFIQQLQGGAGDAADVRLNRRGTLIVHTNNVGDAVEISRRDGRLVVQVGDTFTKSVAPSRVRKIAVYLHDGDDTLTIGADVGRGVYCDGGDGNDTLSGGGGNDILFGGAGKDRLFGFDGDDVLMGGGGNDYLLGGAGKDDLFGNRGNDMLSGAGGNDRLVGGGDVDRCLGGNGDDAAAVSEEDEFSSIERFLDSP